MFASCALRARVLAAAAQQRGGVALAAAQLRAASNAAAAVADAHRRHVCNFEVKGQKMRIELAVAEDRATLIDFASKAISRNEPSSHSIGLTPDDARPFVESVVDNGIKEPMCPILLAEDGTLVAVLLGCRKPIDHSAAVEPHVRKNYSDVIDELKGMLPSRKTRRVIGPAFDLHSMGFNFLPKSVTETARMSVGAVRDDFQGHNILKKMVHEFLKVAKEMGLEYSDAVTTSLPTEKCLKKFGYEAKHSIPYDTLVDGNERIHAQTPLKTSATALKVWVNTVENALNHSPHAK